MVVVGDWIYYHPKIDLAYCLNELPERRDKWSLGIQLKLKLCEVWIEGRIPQSIHQLTLLWVFLIYFGLEGLGLKCAWAKDPNHHFLGPHRDSRPTSRYPQLVQLHSNGPESSTVEALWSNGYQVMMNPKVSNIFRREKGNFNILPWFCQTAKKNSSVETCKISRGWIS